MTWEGSPGFSAVKRSVNKQTTSNTRLREDWCRGKRVRSGLSFWLSDEVPDDARKSGTFLAKREKVEKRERREMGEGLKHTRARKGKLEGGEGGEGAERERRRG